MGPLKLNQLSGLGSGYHPNDRVELCEQGFGDAQSDASVWTRSATSRGTGLANQTWMLR